MATPILIIDNHMALQVIEKQYPELENAPLILLSKHFSLNQLEVYDKRGYTYFDELITEEDENDFSIHINDLLWNWFLDSSGQDISRIEECSLGCTFSNYMEVIFTKLLTSLTGLKKLLNRDYKVYCTSSTDYLILAVITFLQKENRFSLEIVKTNDNKKFNAKAKKLENKYSIGRLAHYNKMFHQVSWKKRIVSLILRWTHVKSIDEKRVLLMSAGKLDNYFEYVRDKGSPNLYRWILPISNVYDLFRRGDKHPIFYMFTVMNKSKSRDISHMIKQLKDNIRERTSVVNPELLITVMDEQIFPYYHGAFSYYRNAVKTIDSLKPDLVIINAEIETHFLVAQAARRNKVTTALLPHGIDQFGFKEIKVGKFQFIDKCFAFGNEDVLFNKIQGVSKTSIIKTSHPWFGKFLPVTVDQQNKYRNALVLPYEEVANSVPEKKSSINKYIIDVFNIMQQLGIKIKYFKLRGVHQLEDNYMDILNESPDKIFQVYGNLSDYLDDVDLVIGPLSTALIETGLCGKPYYSYMSHRHFKLTKSLNPSICKFVNVADNMEQLLENIKMKQPYQNGCSVHDLIDLEGIQNRNELYTKFESRIQLALE